MEEEKRENKYVVVDFFTDWCVYCHKMNNETYSNKKVINEINKNFIAAKLDCESNNLVKYDGKWMKESEVAELFGVDSYPTTAFLTNDGEKITIRGAKSSDVMDKIPGFIKDNIFQLIAKYVGEGAYKTQNINDYAKSLN